MRSVEESTWNNRQVDRGRVSRRRVIATITEERPSRQTTSLKWRLPLIETSVMMMDSIIRRRARKSYSLCGRNFMSRRGNGAPGALEPATRGLR